MPLEQHDTIAHSILSCSFLKFTKGRQQKENTHPVNFINNAYDPFTYSLFLLIRLKLKLLAYHLQ
jgi:hypothetical protein